MSREGIILLKCPLGHLGEEGLQCTRGSLASDKDMGGCFVITRGRTSEWSSRHSEFKYGI